MNNDKNAYESEPELPGGLFTIMAIFAVTAGLLSVELALGYGQNSGNRCECATLELNSISKNPITQAGLRR